MKTLICLFIFVIHFYSSLVLAQIDINGVVTDSELKPISNVLVEIMDKSDSSNYYTATTDTSGSFQILNIISDIKFSESLPQKHLVLRNYPNPFNPSTIIYYELPTEGNIKIKIYDLLGREVRELINRYEKEGTHQIYWDGRNNWNSPVAAGIYLCQLATKSQFIVHKMILLDGGSNSISFSNRRLNRYDSKLKSVAEQQFNFSVEVSGSNILKTIFSNLRCTKDTTLNLIVPRVLVQKTIGLDGGVIQSDDFQLIIPSGAFNESNDLELGVDNNADLFDTKLTNVYRIDGLPDIIYKTVKLRIKLKEIPADTISLGVGSNFVDLISQDQFISFDAYSAYDSSGYLVSELLPNTETNLSKASNSHRTKSVQYFVALISPGKVISSDGNFRIKFPKSLKEFIPDIDDQLVDGINTYTNLGFKRKINGVYNKPYWPLQVKIENKKTSKYVIIVDNKGKPEIIINKKYVVNTEMTNINYHLGKAIYYCFALQDYKRDDMFNNDHYWLHYALFSWLGHMFTTETEHVPPSFKLLKNYGLGYKHILYGLHYEWPFSNTEGAIAHGISVTPLIDYFAKDVKYGNSIISKIYYNLELKIPALNAIIKSIEEEEYIWWETFLQRYIDGKIYGISDKEFISGILDAYTLEIENENNFDKIFSLEYENISANLYKININNINFNEKKKFRFTLSESGTNASSVNISVWGINNDNLDFIMQGYDIILKDNMAELLQKNYSSLLLCVSNSYGETPFKEKVKIDLNIKLYEQEHYYKKCTLHFSLSGEYLYDSTETDLKAMGYWEFNKGVHIDGDYFTAYWDSTDSYINEYDKESHWSQDQYISGNINFDLSDTTISNIYAELHGLSYLQDFNRNETTTSIRLIDFPIQKTYRGKNWIEWKVEGLQIDLSKLIVRDRVDSYTKYSGESWLEFQTTKESEENFIKLIFYE